MVETQKTLGSRAARLRARKSIQDYIVTPDQDWIDGIAAENASVRQFVAMPLGTGHSVEAQLTSQEIVGGNQIEVIPAKECRDNVARHVRINPHSLPPGYVQIFVKTLSGKTITLNAALSETIDQLSSCARSRTGTPPPPHITWDIDNQIAFHVQIANAAACRRVLGFAPPETPITQQTHARHGLPYFDLHDEKPSGVPGEFGGVESVNALDKQGERTEEKKRAAAEVDHSPENLVVMLDKAKGCRAKFRAVSVLAGEVRDLRL
ncbi:hypothetical protein MBLNU230_g8188t1 [Neophaeotheca triangularis]